MKTFMKPGMFRMTLGAALSLALAAGAAVAQPAPPPRDRRADGPPPPPPPRGPSIRIERDAGGVMRLDVHCGEAETAKGCADVALAVLDKVNAGSSAK